MSDRERYRVRTDPFGFSTIYDALKEEVVRRENGKPYVTRSHEKASALRDWLNKADHEMPAAAGAR